MTKTKRQLRAEAMERLKATRMDSGSAVKKLAMALGSEWNPPSVNYNLGCLKSRLIDLLTDDDSIIAEIESTIELLSDGADSREKLEVEASELVADYAVSGNVCDALYHGIIALLDRQAAITTNELTSQSDVPKSEETTENSTAKNEIRDFDDTREKLEAEVMATVSNLVKYCDAHPALFEKAKSWLNRQAAITEEKTRYKWVTASAEEIAAWRSKAEKLKEQVYELTAERDDWKAKAEGYAEALEKLGCSVLANGTVFEPSGNLDAQSRAEIEDVDMSDSREKLEADVLKYYTHTTSTLMWPVDANIMKKWVSVSMDTVLEWLDRQAAITERECREYEDALREQHHKRIAELKAELDELRDELAATKKHLKVSQGQLSVTLNNWEQAKGKLRRQKEALDERAAKLDERAAKTSDEIAAEEIDRWKDKAEKARDDAETWRKACGDVLDAADEIHRIMAYHFPNGR